MLLQCTLTDALLSLSLESELMMAHWLECCLAVNLWFMICFQGLYGIGIHKSRNGLGPAYLTYRLSPEATVSQLQSAEWLIWSSLGSFSGRSPSARVRQPQLSFWNIVLTFRKKMVKSSVAWRRYAGIAEFFHANGVFFFFFVWMDFLGASFTSFHHPPFPPLLPFFALFWGQLESLNVHAQLLGLLMYTGLLTALRRVQAPCLDPRVSLLESWSQSQGVCVISREPIPQLQRVFTFLTRVTRG